nr:MAG TPA: transmembrane protein [Caudoviricetes sp.]
MSANNNSTGGIGFCGLLSIVFIILKLTHFIDWSWWWVLSPLWLPLAAALSIILVILVLKAIFKS